MIITYNSFRYHMITTGLKSRITSNLFLFTKPLFSQPFTLSLFLCFSLTEKALHNANDNVKTKARRERERERDHTCQAKS